jgi:rhomboid family GlyGly-CTERM serine protease
MLSDGGAAWLALACLLAACAALGWFTPRSSIDWQPARAASEPWRALSAVGVHYSARHLAGNLAGAALAGAFGVVAQVPLALALAWLAAWPLTQIGLLLRPELAHYGGLSGVLHAGIAIVALWLLVSATTRAQRWVAVGVIGGLVAKLLNEAPWGPLLRHSPGWDISVAPFVHASGAVAGALCAGIALGLRALYGNRPGAGSVR